MLDDGRVDIFLKHPLDERLLLSFGGRNIAHGSRIAKEDHKDGFGEAIHRAGVCKGRIGEHEIPNQERHTDGETPAEPQQHRRHRHY